MSGWVKVGDVQSSTGTTFAKYACKTCRRECTTCGSEPSLLCVCNPTPHRPKRRDSGGMRKRR